MAPDASAGDTPDLASAPDAASNVVSCTGYRYCDNFESYNGAITTGVKIGPWMPTITGTGTTMMVDAVKPYSGSKALHITVPAGAATRDTLNQTVQAGLVPGNNLFGRAMIYYSNTGGNGLALAVHSWMFNASGTSTKAAGGVTMNLGGGGAQFQLNYHPPAPGVESSVDSGTQTAGMWHCLQWQYDGSGSPPKDEGKIWVDGKLAVDALPAKGWDFATPWSSFDFGFTHYQTLNNPVDIYLDDFALNETMIPCPP